MASRLGHEGAATRDPDQQSLADQRIHCLPDGHPRDAEPLDELTLGGGGRTRLASLDEGTDVLPDLDVL